MKFKLLATLLLLSMLAKGNSEEKQSADLIIKGAIIYTVDAHNTQADAMAIKDGMIIGIGMESQIMAKFQCNRILNLGGKFIYPGFIDAHCHFYGYALGLQYIDLNGCKSFAEVIDRLKNNKNAKNGGWIVGRGWDQNLWEVKEFPDNKLLTSLYPDIPVMLIRVDGHVVLANEEALKRANIGLMNQFGQDQVDVANKQLTGILRENAADLMRENVPSPTGHDLENLIHIAENDCFKSGLTTLSDAGLEYAQVKTIDSLQKSGKLKIGIYAMLAPSKRNLEEFVAKGIYQTDRLKVNSIKIYMDGSLGSRTARLKSPYTDDLSKSGIIVTSEDSIIRLCELAYRNGYQVNTHCIGDSAVRLILDIYAKFLKHNNDRRWRVEHAQVVDPLDLILFRKLSVVPSVQATHATSDMRWAGARLGPERVKHAYTYKDLLVQNGWIANGTDFPIEQISPLLTFYASVSRQDLTGYPAGGFLPENALTRKEALQSITIWAAKANFMDQKRGSLEVGKYADFVVLNKDILTIPIREVPLVVVEKTYVLGEEVYQK